MVRVIWVVVASMAWGAWAAEAPLRQAPADVEFERDVVYATAEGEELKLNIARPKDAAKDKTLPCIVVIHGGAWRAGHRNGHDDLTWRFAKMGYVSATVSYRFCPKHVFPAQVQDVKAAVRFLRGNAEKYGIDAKKIGAIGFSAGAHLSMMLGVMDKEDGFDDVGEYKDQSSKVSVVVSYFGPTDMMQEFPPASRGLLRDFIGGTKEEKPEEHKKASPINYLDKSDAAILLFQGTQDPLVPHSQATLMTEAMTRAGVKGRVELMIGAGHGWGGTELMRTVKVGDEFLAEQLKRK